ncbi:MAG: XdhC family protein [Anaerolineae bacterium]
MADDHRAVYQALARAIEEGNPSALATVISTIGSMPRHAGSKMLIYQDGQIVGTVGGGAMESAVIASARQVIDDQQPRTESYTLNDLSDGDPGICGGSAMIFIEPVAIPPTLLVIGGGHVGKALSELGKWMGYRVILSDDREIYCNPDYVPGLDGYLVTSPDTINQHIHITSHTYVATVTRGISVDEKLLPVLIKSDASYIGLIGSRRRWAITARTLREKQGITDAELQRIHSPIGLELEAESPREIALSIMAEITMLRRGGTGQPMRWHGTVDEA